MPSRTPRTIALAAALVLAHTACDAGPSPDSTATAVLPPDSPPSPATGHTLHIKPVFRVTADQGGPETGRGVLGVSPRGDVAFTFGADDEDMHVTVMDSTGRISLRLGARGNGPGEFQSVFNVLMDEERIVLAGVGQVSAFDRRGRHLWSRGTPPSFLAVALHADSVDLMDGTYFASGERVGDLRRQSLRLNGRDRLLLSGDAPFLRDLARSPSDSARFVRLAFASRGRELVIGNGLTFRLARVDAAGRLVRRFGRDVPLLVPGPEEIETEVARQVEVASRPFRLPDGTTRRNPVPTAEIRARASAPRPYLRSRRGGLHMDPRSGDVFTIETTVDSVRITRFAATDDRQSTVTVACDARDGSAALSWPFVALTCRGQTDDAPELQLYYLSLVSSPATPPSAPPPAPAASAPRTREGTPP